jgi:hypothetical protein
VFGSLQIQENHLETFLKVAAAIMASLSVANNNSIKKSAAVLYHYPCPDGAFAALAAHLYFKATSLPAIFFPNTVYSPIKPDQLPLHQFSHVYLLDFVGPSGFVQQLSSKVPRS